MELNNGNVKVISFYLPQFHPFEENNAWWGEGFTEWTNVGKAKPLFKGHYQPKVPADLGYYDLRVPEVAEKQAILARKAGVTGFVYYHYWFSGKTLMDMPSKRMLYCKKPNFPFCFAIAAHLEPEILVVDEVLAVGDAEFQKKAIGKMKDVSQGGGRTVLFVSHNMAAVKKLCKRGVVL